MNDENGQGRIVQCTITMEFIEEQHFPAVGFDNEGVIAWAMDEFIVAVKEAYDNDTFNDYVQARIIE